MSANQIKGLDVQQVDELLSNGDLALAVKVTYRSCAAPMNRP
jgi:hypothetical protein